MCHTYFHGIGCAHEIMAVPRLALGICWTVYGLVCPWKQTQTVRRWEDTGDLLTHERKDELNCCKQECNWHYNQPIVIVKCHNHNQDVYVQRIFSVKVPGDKVQPGVPKSLLQILCSGQFIFSYFLFLKVKILFECGICINSCVQNLRKLQPR